MGSAMQLRLGMLVWGWLLLLAGLFGGLVPVASSAQSAAAAAPIRPAEEPPSDFTGTQYIDSTGCVFLREGKAWRARLLQGGTPVCGYPPTPIGAAKVREIPAPVSPALDGMGRIEAELVATLTANLAPGELVSDPRQPPSAAAANAATPQPRKAGAPEGGAGSAADQIAVGLAVSAPIRAAAAGRDAPNARLCGLLGLPAAGAGGALGPDPTGGFCGGPPSAKLTPRVAAAEDAASAAAMAHAARRADAGSGVSASGRPEGGGNHLKAPAPARPATGPQRLGTAPTDAYKDTLKRPVQPKSRTEAMIPAGARYLQVLRTEDAVMAEEVLSRLRALGLPAARERGDPLKGQVLLAGPFPSRQAIVSAHDRLTRAGFKDLLPR